MKIFKELESYLNDENTHLPIFNENFHIVNMNDYEAYSTLTGIPLRFKEPHKSEFFEIAITDKDSTGIKVGEYTIDNINNTIVAISPYQVRSIYPLYTNNENEYSNGFMIYFKPEFIDSSTKSFDIQKEFPFFKIQTAPIYRITKKQQADIWNITEKIYEEAHSNRPDNYGMIIAYLFVLLYKIKRISYNEDSVFSINRFESITSKFEQIIVSDKEKFLTVSEYANKMNISPVYLNECVKKATGNSAQQTINDYKILHAKSLLNQSNKPIIEIATELGYSEMTNFTRFFKKNTGLTPLNFRKNCLVKDKNDF